MSSNDLSFASTETKFKNPITKTQNNIVIFGFYVYEWYHSIPSQIYGSQKGLEPKIRLYCTKSPPNFESTSDETLEALCEHFEALIDDNPKLLEADVTLASGVLTLLLPHPFGTYVINKQSPNQQIWLSSPQSGPIRYISGNCSILTGF